jgi:hypothetical protein
MIFFSRLLTGLLPERPADKPKLRENATHAGIGRYATLAKRSE